MIAVRGRTCGPQAGMTTVEVLVVLVLLGLLAALVAVRAPSPAFDGSSLSHGHQDRIAGARLRALRERRVVVVVDSVESGADLARGARSVAGRRLRWSAAFPDGSVVTDVPAEGKLILGAVP